MNARLKFLITSIACTCGGLIILACHLDAHAEGFNMYAWGARGTALAGGMVARADDASAVAHNPAGITQIDGISMLGGVTFIMPSGKIDTINNGVETCTPAKYHTWTSPHMFFTQQINENFWWGIGMFSRFGLGNSFKDDWPGSANIRDIKIQTLSLNPNIAWKVNDHLSVAAGVEVIGARAVIGHGYDLSAIGYGFQGQRVKGTGANFGGNLAVHYKFNDQWSAGITYRLPTHISFSGENKWDRQFSTQ